MAPNIYHKVNFYKRNFATTPKEPTAEEMLWLHMIIGKLHWFPDQIITKLYVHGMTRVSPSFSVIAAAAADCVNTYTYRDFLKESNQVYTNIYTK